MPGRLEYPTKSTFGFPGNSVQDSLPRGRHTLSTNDTRATVARNIVGFVEQTGVPKTWINSILDSLQKQQGSSVVKGMNALQNGFAMQLESLAGKVGGFDSSLVNYMGVLYITLRAEEQQGKIHAGLHRFETGERQIPDPEKRAAQIAKERGNLTTLEEHTPTLQGWLTAFEQMTWGENAPLFREAITFLIENSETAFNRSGANRRKAGREATISAVLSGNVDELRELIGKLGESFHHTLH